MRCSILLVAAGLLSAAPGLVSAASPDETPTPQATAPAIPDATIGKAGAALHDVAKVQAKYQQRMESASPEQRKGLSEQANAEAVQAIQAHGISVSEYSNVVQTARNDPQIKQRLLAAANKAQ